MITAKLFRDHVSTNRVATPRARNIQYAFRVFPFFDHFHSFPTSYIILPHLARLSSKFFLHPGGPGRQVTWGQRLGRQDPPELQNVVEVFGTPYSFAALIRDTSDIPRPNDHIVAWGDSQSGGRTDYPKKLPRHLEVFEVKAIHSHFDGSNNGVFIAEVRDQDSRDVLHAWGDPRYGALVADVSERSSERSQRSLQTTAPCLSSAVMTRNSAARSKGSTRHDSP